MTKHLKLSPNEIIFLLEKAFQNNDRVYYPIENKYIYYVEWLYCTYHIEVSSDGEYISDLLVLFPGSARDLKKSLLLR